jgi:hypothetical protein
MEDTHKKDTIETASDNEAPAHETPGPVRFFASTDIMRGSYYQGYHDAFKDILFVAILYGIALYFALRWVGKG